MAKTKLTVRRQATSRIFSPWEGPNVRARPSVIRAGPRSPTPENKRITRQRDRQFKIKISAKKSPGEKKPVK